MKVLIVYHYFPHYRKAVMSALRDSDEVDYYFAADVLSPNDIKVFNVEDALGGRFIKLDNFWLTKSILWQRGLLKSIFCNKFDRVIFLGDPNFISTWISSIGLKVLGVPFFFWTHGFLGRNSKFSDAIRLFFFKLATGLLVYGQNEERRLRAAGVKNIDVVWNSLDLSLQSELRQKFQKKEKLDAFVFVGRLTNHKKLDLLIKAFSQIKNKSQILIFVGDGQAKSTLERLAAELLVDDRVIFYGECHDEEKIAEIFSRAVACVSPGEVGLTAMHSLVYGTPVITHSNELKQMPESESVVDGVTGFLFEEDCIDGLTQVMDKMNSDISHSMYSKCIEIIDEKFNPSNQVRIINRVVKTLS